MVALLPAAYRQLAAFALLARVGLLIAVAHACGTLFWTHADPQQRRLRWPVPLLALPQSTHCAPDGCIWRRGGAG